jgi:hypothetical protein
VNDINICFANLKQLSYCIKYKLRRRTQTLYKFWNVSRARWKVKNSLNKIIFLPVLWKGVWIMIQHIFLRSQTATECYTNYIHRSNLYSQTWLLHFHAKVTTLWIWNIQIHEKKIVRPNAVFELNRIIFHTLNTF